ncbi:hypothetical protein SAMN03080594_102794 [Arenibacter palladensis]|uniref:Uncharacterized protein n=1 Tax=Arenibacter palladensis TaxID=237373 RepID=A0A1M4ZEA3_9FLAO|nr:hypothetical protein SAMN03080594_102794 [Arenibacter palladensis]
MIGIGKAEMAAEKIWTLKDRITKLSRPKIG